MIDEEFLVAVIAQETRRELATPRAQACLQDRMLEPDDLIQELTLHGYELARKFDWGRYQQTHDAQRAFRIYLRQSYRRKILRLLTRSARRRTLSLHIDIQTEDTFDE